MIFIEFRCMLIDKTQKDARAGPSQRWDGLGGCHLFLTLYSQSVPEHRTDRNEVEGWVVLRAREFVPPAEPHQLAD